jgi:hypothetical protein
VSHVSSRARDARRDERAIGRRRERR